MVTVSEPTEIVLDWTGEAISRVEIKPSLPGMECLIEGNRLRLTGVVPCKVAIVCNGDDKHPIYLFANAPEPLPWQDFPDGTIRFPKGVHEIGVREITKDNTFIFLEEGAVVRGCFHAKNVCNLHIAGYGVIDGRDTKRAIRCERSEGIVMEGPLLLSDNGWTAAFFECKNVEINNVKILSSQEWSDGIDILATSDVVIDDIFVRNEDDCICIKTKKFIYAGNVENVIVRNSTFWSGKQGNALEVGYELDVDYVRNIRFENIDIIRKETSVNKFRRAAISIHHNGNAAISDISFKDIRIESVDENLIWIGLIPAGRWGDGGGSIENVTLENIVYSNGPPAPVYIDGTPTGKVNNIRFKNFNYLSKPVRTVADDVFKIEQAHVIIE